MMKQRRHMAKAWIEYTNKGAKNDMVGYYHVVVKAHMTGDHAQATFGGFDKINDTWAEYTSTLWSNNTGEITHSYESEYLDDIGYLRNGMVEYF